MGVYTRPDSRYYWMYLERLNGRKGFKERTAVLIGPQNKPLAERVYHDRMRELAATEHFAPRRLRPSQRDANGWCYIYFITDGDAIKIGRTINIVQRLQMMQTSHPKRLTVVALFPAHVTVERLIHRRFKAARCPAPRVWGEWFMPTPELLAFIDTVKAGGNPLLELVNHSQSAPVSFASPENDPKHSGNSDI